MKIILFYIRISLKFVPVVPIDNSPALIEIMAWFSTGDKPLSESMINQVSILNFYWCEYALLDLDMS